MEQGVSTQLLDALVSELVHPVLMQSRDKGIKILTACCIANLLRLYAPDAPYTESELAVAAD
jgi:sister-chromatid-cohesion protein PDS5